MKRIELAGSWSLMQDAGEPIKGALPGCTYLDYIASGMEDPFWGENETAATELAHHDYTYSRSFEVTEDVLSAANVELVAMGIDTLCTVSVNGVEAAKTDNIHRTWRIPVKELLKVGENEISLFFPDPYVFAAEKLAADRVPGNFKLGEGFNHLRKTACHFGWDWGPELPPAGITGSIRIEAWDARIEDLKIIQRHEEGRVSLDLSWQVTEGKEGEMRFTLTAPNGSEQKVTAAVSGNKAVIDVNDPQLWWCNGLGEQPLYQLKAELTVNGRTEDEASCQIGLRTIELDTHPDEHGEQFRFIVNGVPIFAKGADWIPADSFPTRITREDTDFYIDSAKEAGMNMLRVWGGGIYETEDFYDACDRDGILVWQDFCFACSGYPFYNEEFLENVRGEVIDNVKRLRHRASLAIWCGNNENEIFAAMWKKGSKEKESNPKFYHVTLREWVNDLDGVTPYWPGSPSSGYIDGRPQSRKKGETRGDAHLWQIWHGMIPIEGFRDLPTRFCSEFGMESMPSMATLRTFTDEKEPNLFDPVMELHQKSEGGNEKMMFYLLQKFRNPKKFEDFVYLTQIVQANTVRFATDCWRRRTGLVNGSLFWQLNDCWPVASWAGIDYGKQWKAVMYHAKEFNKALCLSNDYFDDRAELYAANDLPEEFTGRLNWRLDTFYGKQISSGGTDVNVPATAAKKLFALYYDGLLKGTPKEDAVLTVSLVNGETVVDEKSWLLVPDKKARLPKAKPVAECTVNNGVATVKARSSVYARYVYLSAKDVSAVWSDNFFDIPAKGEKTVTVAVPEGMTAEELLSKLEIKTLTDVEPKGTVADDKRLAVQMVMKKKNYLTWLIFKFL